MYKYLILISITFLTACGGYYQKDESSPLYGITEGSALVLNQPLTIPANQTTVILQYGRVVTRSELDIYHANCLFEINTLSDKPRTVNPDTFVIYKVVDQRMTVSLDKIMLAGLVMSDGGGSIGDLNYTTTLYLRSEQQPDVLKMACRHWESPEDDNYLSIEQIRQAIGQAFTLRLAE